jgi:hypothetical protein
MECWSIGVLGFNPLLQHSTPPILQSFTCKRDSIGNLYTTETS